MSDLWRKKNARSMQDEIVYVDGNCIVFEADESSVYLHHEDAIAVAKAILEHFDESGDTVENGEETARLTAADVRCIEAALEADRLALW